MNNLSPFVSRGVFDELFRDVSPGFFVKPLPLHGDALPAQIKVEVKENPKEFIVHAEIPGAGKENINVDIKGNIVTIVAQISQIDSEGTEDKPLRSERYYGEVSRSFQLATEIDEANSKARYKHGVLTLNLLKKQKKGGLRLTIE
jgi:HSP20 family protein